MNSQPPDDPGSAPHGQPEEEILKEEDAVQPNGEEDQITVELLRRKHTALKNRSSQIDQGTWEFVGEQWCQLVYQIEDLSDAEALLREGVIKFTGRASETKLREMLEQAQRGLYIQSALEFPADRDWPGWIERPNAYKRALSLVDDIEMLAANPEWESLQERALKWRSLMLEKVLPAYLDQENQSAHQQARMGDFALALQTIQNALAFLPGHLMDKVPASVDHEGMTALRDALVARQECEAALWRGIVRLVNNSASFQQVVTELNSPLIEHPDVVIDDLRTTLTDLRKAAGIESALGTLTAPDEAAAASSRLERLSQTRFAILEETPEFLAQADPRLSNKLQTRLSKLLADIDRAPKESLKKLIASFDKQEISHPNLIPDLVERYWQLRWYLDNGQITDPDLVDAAQEALDWTQERPHLMLLHTAQLFENLDSPVKLQELLINLDTIRSLIQNLSTHPSGEANASMSSTAGPLVDQRALEEWYKIVSSWMKTYQKLSQGANNIQPQAQNSSQMTTNEVETIRHQIKTLKEEIWPQLDLPPWGEDSAAASIESESSLFLVLFEVFQQIESERKTRNPVEAAIYLDERLFQTGLHQNMKAPTIWFWEPQRKTLLKRSDALVKSIQSDIDTYLGELLETSQDPLKSLEQKVFLRPVPDTFVPTIRRRVEQHAKRLSQKRDETISRAEWLSRWDNVLYAVRTWAGDMEVEAKPSLNIKGFWLDLQGKIDWERGLDSILSRRREIGIALGLVAFLIVFIFGGSALLRRANQSARRSVSAPSLEDTRPEREQALLDGTSENAGAIPTTAAPSATLTPTEDTRFRTATAQAVAALNATQAAANLAAATQTQGAVMTEGAAQAALLEQTATAGAIQGTSTAQAAASATAAADPAFLATSQALRCFEDASAPVLEVSDQPTLNPSIGSIYIYGSQAFPVYASWFITNQSQCDWNTLAVAPLGDGDEPRFSFWDEEGQVEVNSDAPLRPGERLKVILSFRPLDAQNIDQDWALVANGVLLDEQPHLSLEVQGWIIPIEATLTNTPKPTEEKSPPRPTSPPPTARP